MHSPKRPPRGTVRKYLNGLRSELRQAVWLLDAGKLQLLPDDIWRSLVNSGHLILFPANQIEDLRQAYFGVAKLNYMFKRCKDISEAYHTEINPLKRRAIRKVWRGTTVEALGMARGTAFSLRMLTRKDGFLGGR
jgi:hypothetical protein